MLATVLFAAAIAGRTSQPNVDPVAKVVELLNELKQQVQDEGHEEARTYDNFACFCKKQQIKKAKDIEKGERKKAKLEGSLKSLAADNEDETFNIGKITSDLAQMQADLAKATEIRNKENAAYVELNADLEKAIASLRSAIQHIQGGDTYSASSGGGNVRILRFVQTTNAVREALMMADALGALPKTKVVQAFMQFSESPLGRENDMDSDYDFHSGGIVDTLQGLLKDFRAQNNKVDAEEASEARAFAQMSAAKNRQISRAQSMLSTEEGKKSSTEADQATDSGLLTETNAHLNDDNLYLKDITGQCEKKAREWDQRSTARNGELEALTKALQIISGTVTNRAAGAGGLRLVQETSPSDDDEASDDYTDVVFVQTEVVKKAVSQVDPKRAKAISMVQKVASEMKSVSLSLLAMKMAADPFAKIKTLIQGLIERLLKEAADEANQKGWCDSSLAKANTDRDFRQGDLEDLSANINDMTAQKRSLEETVRTLKSEIHDLNRAHHDAAQLRNREKNQNKHELTQASEGLAALKNAISVLQEFYKGAAKETTSFVQEDASPVDEAIASRGKDGAKFGTVHKGAYQGNQEQATGILGMLATIETDFERTIKEISTAESEAAAEFTAYDRETKASIAGKETQQARSEADIKELAGNLGEAYFSLEQNQNLLDQTMRILEDLRPQCVDTTMSTDERNSRREAEVAALKKAVCVLDKEDDAIDECNGSGTWTGGFLQK